MNQRVAEAFKKLYFGKRTGVLTCESRSARRAVFFRSGFVVGAKSSLDEDRLGEVMMRHERITRQQFDDASHFIKSGWKLGEILVELKVIEASEIERFVRLQLLDVACMQLVSPPKRLAFSPLTGVDAVVEAPISVADILMEAARRTTSIRPHLEALRKDSRRLGFPKDPMKRFQDVNLKPEEAFVLSRIDGTQTPGDIFAVSPLPEEDTARALLGLLRAEVVEPEGEGSPENTETTEAALMPPSSPESPLPGSRSAAKPKAKPRTKAASATTPADTERESAAQKERERDRERVEIERTYQEFQFKDHWQVLGLEREASSEAVKEAFFRLAKRYHPDRYRRITDPDFHEQVSYVFQRVHEAYETLGSAAAAARYQALTAKEAQYEQTQKEWSRRTGSGPAKGRAPDGRAAPDEAEAKALFRRAKQAFQGEDFWSAIELARQAIDAAPETAAYYHLLGLALAKNPKWRQDAEKNLKIATNLDSWNAGYLLDLAKLYEEAGLHLRARKTYEQAKAVDPTARVPGD